ncbi:MAG TPA: hypothetical protein VNN22_24180 [Verrucomicrobiae bacterium]|nr:hypothetical protein [Verrucomicrobiae bacterium]
MPTSDFSKITVGGPCKITDVATVIYTEGNVTITPKPVYRDIPSSLTTKDDQILIGLTYEIDYTPKSIWSAGYRGVFLPPAYTNFAAGGARIIGAANRAVTVLGADGEQHVFTRAALSKMPNVFFGLGKGLYGAAQHTAFLGNGKALTDADAFVVQSSGVAWDQSDFPTGHQEAECTAAWGAVAGFTALFAQEGFELQHEMEWADVKQGNILVDKRIVGYRGMMVFKPEGPTTTQLVGQFPGVIGTRLSTGAADLVVTGSGISGTLKGAMPFRGKYNFDNKLLRHDEFAFVGAIATPGTRLAFS